MFIPLLQDKLSPLYFASFTTSYKNILSGLYLSLYPLGQFLGSPIIGAFSDKFGRKNILVNSLIMTTICLLIIAYAIHIKSLILLAIGCFVAGLGESNMALVLSAIADLTTVETRSAEFARAWVMCSLGYITGSMFGGVASFIGYIYPFIIEALLVTITFISVMTFFIDNVQQRSNSSIKKMILNFTQVFHKNNLRPYYFANFISYIACFGILRVELIYMQEYFQLSQFQISIFYSYASVIAMIANFLITPFLLKSLSVRKIVLLAGFAAFLSGIIFILPTNKAYLWVTTGLIGFFVPITVAMIGALISNRAEVQNQGAVMGNNQSLQVLAEAVSAIVGGLIFSLSPKIPFIVFTIIGMFSLTIYKQLKH
jgi:DHA1 family tetracycline resistance protein-like MFS transporter